jgi:hypothetical protein
MSIQCPENPKHKTSEPVFGANVEILDELYFHDSRPQLTVSVWCGYCARYLTAEEIQAQLWDTTMDPEISSREQVIDEFGNEST